MWGPRQRKTSFVEGFEPRKRRIPLLLRIARISRALDDKRPAHEYICSILLQYRNPSPVVPSGSWGVRQGRNEQKRCHLGLRAAFSLRDCIFKDSMAWPTCTHDHDIEAEGFHDKRFHCNATWDRKGGAG